MKYALSLIAVLALSSCEAPGYRAAQERVIRPGEVANFDVLYAQNCSACHGAKGEGALTVGIGTPVYLAIADDSTIRNTIEKGRPGTPMSAFARNAGGMLTDAQIEILVRGIRQRWGKALESSPPAYVSAQPGDTAHGQEVFKESCARCHGAGSIADPSYLSLVTDQHLRTVIIVGMPNLGMPDWRGYSKPLSDAEITDVVAWLAGLRNVAFSQRRQSFSAQVKN
jgi:cytochrome c oxidase cbb3-type subunit III